MRGTLAARELRELLVGIIPACAGNTVAGPRHHGAEADHPRVCGEHGAVSRESRLQEGSSPRVRGTLVSPDLVLSVVGIIPACAGNTEGDSLRPAA